MKYFSFALIVVLSVCIFIYMYRNESDKTTISQAVRMSATRSVPTHSMLTPVQEAEFAIQDILAQRYTTNKSNIVVIIKNSTDTNFYGYYGMNCDMTKTAAENEGCSHVLYASKLPDGYHVIDSPKVSCEDLSKIVFTLDANTVTHACK